MIKSIHHSVLMVLLGVLVSACSHGQSARLDPWKGGYSRSAKIFDDLKRQRAERDKIRSETAETESEDGGDDLPDGLAGFDGGDETYYRLGDGSAHELFADLSSAPKKLAINFRDAEIADVVSAILGEVLHRPFALASDVEGQIDLRVGGRISEVALVSALRAQLDDAGYRLSRRNGVFEVARVVDAEHSEPRVGDGFVAIPILNTTPQNVATLLQQTFPQISTMTVDDKTGYIYVWSNQELRKKILRTVKMFDTNMLTGRQLVVVPLVHTDAERMMAELAQVYPQEGQTEAINYSPLVRQNAILLTGRSDKLVTQLRKIIQDLDRPTSNGQQIYIIELEHSQAEVVAGQLSQLGWGGAPVAQNTPEAGVGAQAEAAAPVASTVTVVPSKHSNSLIVRANTEEYRQILAAVKKLDKQPIQILIEATIIEVTLNDRLQFGVQSLYEGLLGQYTVGFSNSTTATVGGAYPGFNALLGTNTSRQTVINALRAVTDVRVLSRPKLIVVNNHDARLQVGEEVPVATRQVTDSTNDTAPTINSIDYQPTGVILTVTPHANRSGKVTLNVIQEVSRVTSIDSTASLTPTVSRRLIETQIDVNSGQTAILGGLISEEETTTRNRLPILGDLPLVGALFGSSDKLVTNTELLVFLTPRVFSGDDDSQEITQELMDSLRGVWEQRDE